MKKRHIYFAAIILLLGLIFNFAHSELGFMTPEGDTDHHSHDFCQLANAATAKSNIASGTLIQKDSQPFLTMVCILPEISHVSNSVLRQITPIQSGSNKFADTPLFVVNRTLLI